MISVICVDDDPDIQLLYKNILGKRGYNLRVFGDGREAIAGFDKESSDIVILDMDMPGLSGLETCGELRKNPKASKIPMVVVSSKDSEEMILSALSNGIDDYILKPFKPSELIAKINYAVKKSRAGIKKNISLSFSEKYQIIHKIDDGAHATVYYAKDTSRTPAREVALKILREAHSEFSEQQSKTLFLREAYEWSKLDHPNIVKLFDFGQSAGSYYLVLEYIDGVTLWDQVHDEGAQEEPSLVYVAYEMVEALAYISKFNLVHRDMKPNNILLSYSGDVKLTDFGLAKQMQDTKMTIMSNVFKGTPDFVSPEQIECEPAIDISSDVYSLGITLYYAATGVYPFRGESIIETLKNHFRITPKPINEVNAKLSQDFASVVDQMIAPEREDRISLKNLKSKLEKLLELDG